MAQRLDVLISKQLGELVATLERQDGRDGVEFFGGRSTEVCDVVALVTRGSRIAGFDGRWDRDLPRSARCENAERGWPWPTLNQLAESVSSNPQAVGTGNYVRHRDGKEPQVKSILSLGFGTRSLGFHGKSLSCRARAGFREIAAAHPDRHSVT